MYKIEFSRTAEQSIESIFHADRKYYSRIINAIEALAETPYKGKKLKGQFKGRYSLRVGNYRIVYKVEKERLIIYVIDLGHRKKIYRRK